MKWYHYVACFIAEPGAVTQMKIEAIGEQYLDFRVA